MFVNGIAKFYKGAIRGTEYHEIFEAIWASFLSPEEREQILTSERNKKGTFIDRESGKKYYYNDENVTDNMLKERIADDFADFRLGKLPARNLTEMVLRFFKNIIEFFKSFVRKPTLKDKLFAEIESGRFKEAKIAAPKIKEGVSELFESNSELANAVYEALGVNNKVSSKVELKHKIAHVYDIIYNGKRIGNFELPLDLDGDNILIGDVEIEEEYRGKGLGVEIYKAAINLSNKPIISLLATDEANRVWESLVRRGLAEKTENGYKSIKPQITPQQKQEAVQVYSNFLSNFVNNNFDNIIQDLESKNILNKKCS